MGFGEEDQRSKLRFSSRRIKGTCYQLDLHAVNLDHLTEVPFVRFLPCTALPPPPLRPAFFGSHLNLGSYALHKLFGILLHRRHVSSPLLIHSIICNCIDSWIFYFILCFIIQSYVIYFVAQIMCVLHCLIFCCYNAGQAHPTPRISHFSEELWFLFSKNGVRS